MILAVAAGIVLVALARRPPAWYADALRLDPAAANDADQKLAATMSWAADVQASQIRRRLATAGGRAGSDTGSEPGPITLEFAERQVNSFVRKWSIEGSGSTGNPWLDPAVHFEKGRIVVAARASGASTVMSVSIDLTIDAQGRLNAIVDSPRAGMLPIPGAMVNGPFSRAQASLKTQMAAWSSGAVIDADGLGNPAAANYFLGKIGIALLASAAGNPMPVDPIVIVPFDPSHPKRELPVKIASIEIDQQSMRVTLNGYSGRLIMDNGR